MGLNRLEKVARIICIDEGSDPDKLEPGNLPRVDGICSNGDPGHYLWREFEPLARKILKALEN